MQPYNYGVRGLDIDFMDLAYKAESMKSMKQKRESDAADEEEQKRLRRLQKRMEEKLTSDPNADLTEEYNLMQTIDPVHSKQLREFGKEMDDDQQRILFQSAYEVKSLLDNELEDEAVKTLAQRNELLRAAGRDNRHTQRALDIYQEHGKDGLSRVLDTAVETGVQGGFLMPEMSGRGKDWTSYEPRYDENGKEYIPVYNGKTDQVYRKYTGSTKPEEDMEVSKNVEKSLIQWNEESDVLAKDATEASRLSQQYATLEQDKISGGLLATIESKAKELAGLEDEESIIRKNATRLTNSRIINNLPKGTASDKDVALVSKGYPKDVTNPATMKEYFDAMSRVLEAEREYKRMRSEFAEATGGINRSRTETELRGIPINRNESFDSFIQNYNANFSQEERRKSTTSPTGAQNYGGARRVKWGELNGRN